jgi:hypothetical protein
MHTAANQVQSQGPRGWNPEVGFDGTLHALFELMLPFYPEVEALAEVQRWLLARSAVQDETFITRLHAGVLRGELVPSRDGANPYFTSDNEFAASVVGLTYSGQVARLTGGSLLDVLAIPGARLCWAFGKSSDEKEQVLRSHSLAPSPLRLPTGGTSLYRPRGEQRLKLAHLMPAADTLGASLLDEPALRRVRMFRSVNPLNMFPLPQAGRRFDHAAQLNGRPLPLDKRDLGETTEVLQCLIALLEEKFRLAGHAETFAAFAQGAQLELGKLDLDALRQHSSQMRVTITPNPSGSGRSQVGRSAAPVLTYDEFKDWARDLVKQYGAMPTDYFVCGVPCSQSLTGGGAPIRHFRIDGFENDDDFNTVYRVAKDARVSALAYFLLLDERCRGDLDAIFRPDYSSRGSRKPVLAYTAADLKPPAVPHLSLWRGEVKGWNVLEQ